MRGRLGGTRAEMRTGDWWRQNPNHTSDNSAYVTGKAKHSARDLWIYIDGETFQGMRVDIDNTPDLRIAWKYLWTSKLGECLALRHFFVPYFRRRSCRVSISVSDVRLTEATDARPAPRGVSSVNPPARGERERARWSCTTGYQGPDARSLPQQRSGREVRFGPASSAGTWAMSASAIAIRVNSRLQLPVAF